MNQGKDVCCTDTLTQSLREAADSLEEANEEFKSWMHRYTKYQDKATKIRELIKEYET